MAVAAGPVSVNGAPGSTPPMRPAFGRPPSPGRYANAWFPKMRQSIDDNFKWVIGGIIGFIVLLIGFQNHVDGRQDALIQTVQQANQQTAETLREVSTVLRMIDERGTSHENRTKEQSK